MSLAHLHSWKVFSRSEGKTRTSERESVKPQVEGTVLKDIFKKHYSCYVYTWCSHHCSEILGNATGPVLVTS